MNLITREHLAKRGGHSTWEMVARTFVVGGTTNCNSIHNRQKNVRVEDGSLIIESHNEPIETMSYSSARLLTKNLGEWKYGRIEVRAKLPTGKGTWSAIWMLPTLDRPMQWPQDGEIDIMEHVGFNTGTIYGTIHTSSNNLISGTQKSDSIKTSNVSQFHVYAIEWDEKSIRWFTDRYEYHRVERLPDDGDSEWPFDKPFHLIINLAVGGNWGGKMGIEENDWPQRMVVDYVRVFQ